MNSTKKTTQKTSGIHKIKLGQLVTLNGHVYQCFCCFDRDYEKYDFCMELPIGLSIKPIKKHKG